MIDSPYKIVLNERFRDFNNYNLEKKSEKNNNFFSPISGYEPNYEPQIWNNKKIKYNHNCYAYVLNTIAPRIGKPQPGYFSNFPHIYDNEYNCFSFYNRLKKDIPSFYLVDFDEKCKKGFYKGFIALDNKPDDKDYHFYRQDKSGYWSHKPGRQDAINYDSNNLLINDPLKANRKYKYFNYSTPCFYFCLNSKLSKSSSII